MSGFSRTNLPICPSTNLPIPLPLYLFLPLISAVIFVVGALLLKRASDLGADVWRTTRIINYTTAAVAVPLWLLGGTIPDSSLWWQPPVGATLFFAGQVFSLLALNTGDVSVATPVMGLKILLVALLSTVLIGDPISARLWTAAGLSSVAIALLNIDRGHPHARVGRTIILAALGAASYACFDVLIQKWSPAWGGGGRILPIVMVTAGLYSIPLRRFGGRGADVSASVDAAAHLVLSADPQVGRECAPGLAAAAGGQQREGDHCGEEHDGGAQAHRGSHRRWCAFM